MNTDRILTSLNNHKIDIKGLYSKVKDENNDILDRRIKIFKFSHPKYFL